MSKFSIKNEKLRKIENIETSSIVTAIKLGSIYPNSKKLIKNLKTYEIENDLKSFFNLLEIEPILVFRLLTKYKLSGYQALNIFMEQNAAFGDEIAFEELSKHSIDFGDFFKGRISALLVFYEINIATYIAKTLNESDNKPIENSQLLSQLYSLFIYLLALYKPEVYSSLMIKDNYSYEDLQFLVKNILGKNLSNFAIELGEVFKLEDKLVELTHFINQAPWNRKRWGNQDPEKAKKLCTINYVGLVLAREIMQHTGVQGLQSTIRSLKRYSGIPQTKIMDAIGALPKQLRKIQNALDLKEYKLPEYISWFENNYFEHEIESNNLELIPDFVEELKLSIFEFQNGNHLALNEAVWVTLKAILICFDFQRASYFCVDKDKINLETCIGTRLFDYEKTEFLNDEDNLLTQTIKNMSLTSNSNPLFRDGFPFFAFPIIENNECRGIFYADRSRRPNSEEIEIKELEKIKKLSMSWKL
jgi:hypothetical protein